MTTAERPQPAARPSLSSMTYRQTVAQLAAAQKTAARSAPAYSRFVNRRLGRLLAAAAYRARLTPNMVTGISAGFTFAGIALMALVPPTAWSGVVITLLLMTGYALDSADGQLARLTGGGTPAGEWLDHVVDAVKVSVMPLALAVGLYRFDAADPVWLLVPLGSAVIAAVLFFAMILTEQLRRQHGIPASSAADGGSSRIRPLLVLPMDYGVLCLSFLLLGFLPAFLIAYTLISAATAAFLAAALVKWYRELAAAPALAAPSTSGATTSGEGDAQPRHA